jgi:hypothetical protein
VASKLARRDLDCASLQTSSFAAGSCRRAVEVSLMSMRRTGWAAAVALLLMAAALVAACGGGSDDGDDGGDGTGDGAASATPTSTVSDGGDASDGGGTAGDGECTVTMSGAMDESWTYPQAVTSFSTDYWLSDDALEAVADVSEESFDDQMARGAQIVTLFQLSCTDPTTFTDGVYMAVTNDTTRSEIPMEAGSYAITGGLVDATGPTGTVFAEAVFDSDETWETVPGSGGLEIASWESGDIEGTLSFDAHPRSDATQTLHVEASFHFVCQVWFDNC